MIQSLSDLLARDIKHSLRRLWRDRLFTSVALVALTLGIGANSAVFSVMEALIFSDIGVPHPEDLVRVGLVLGDSDIPLSGPLFDALSHHHEVIRDVMAWALFDMYLEKDGRSQPLDGALISGSGFSLLHVKPSLGRLLGSSDDVPGGGPIGFAAVISNRMWRTQFQSSSSVLGRELVINGIPVTIVGVLPSGFTGMVVGSSPDVVLPLEFESRVNGALSQRHFAGSTWLMVFGRKEPHTPISKVAARLYASSSAILKEGLSALPSSVQKDLLTKIQLKLYPGKTGIAEQVSFHGPTLRELYERPVFAAQGLACFLLFLCVVNLTVLQFARTKGRQHELAVRSSLGEGRFQIWRDLALESTIIGLLGTALGLWAGSLIRTMLSIYLANQQQHWLLKTDWNLKFVLIILASTITCTFLSGVLPVFGLDKEDQGRFLKESGSRVATVSATSQRGIQFLIPLQVSVCMVLLVSAGLFLSTITRLLNVQMGFDPRGVMFFSFNTGSDASKFAQEKRVETEVIKHLRSLHEVSAVSFLDVLPIGGGVGRTSVEAEDRLRRVDMEAAVNGVGPGYLAVMKIQLMAGRDFSPDDNASTPAVCMVSISAARYLFPGQSVLGQHLTMPSPRSPSFPASCEIVGVVGDTKYNDLRAESPRLVYVDEAQALLPVPYIAVRTSNIGRSSRAFEEIMYQVSPATRVSPPKVLEEQLRDNIGSERLLCFISCLFGILAVLVTVVGLYGFLTWNVVRRTRELGIRLALGAEARDVARLVTFETFILLTIGIFSGGVVALLLMRLAKSMLFGTTPSDPLVYGFATLTLTALGLLASWIPAMRAANIEPAIALRTE